MIKLTGALTGGVALLDKLEVREVMDFNSTATWGAIPVPGPGDAVRIPAVACVGLTNAAVNWIDVEGELLVIDGASPATQFSLSTRSLNVRTATGLFQVGTEGVPYQNGFTLTLDDDTTGIHEDVNALRVFDRGWIEMHGKKRTSWTHLAADAGPSDASLLVAGADWAAGDRIVIASSDKHFDHAEERIISSFTVLPGGSMQMALQSPLQWSHCGQIRAIYGNFNPPRTLDQRAEVGLLSRNVRVVAFPRTANGTPGYGGHIMVSDMGNMMTNPPSPTGVHGGFARISHIELDNMGRIGQLGRYPMHWHLQMKQGHGQYMEHCSIHHSNNRAVAVHLTDGIRFERNVCYEHRGHGVFIEDGSEEDNEFLGNLVLGSRVAEDAVALLGSERHNFNPNNQIADQFQNRSPASFWITNPNNRFVGNVAAGSQGVGYWFALPKRFMNRSAEWNDPNVNAAVHQHLTLSGRPAPNRQVLGAFTDNSCHSSWIGFDVNDGIDIDNQTALYQTDIAKNETWQPEVGVPGVRTIQTLTGFVAYTCKMALYTGNGDKNLRFERCILADSTWGVAMASHDTLADSAIIQDAGSQLWSQVPSEPGSRAAIGLYDGAATLADVSVFGFDTTGNTLRLIGAARRRTNWAVSGLRSYPNLAATAQVWSGLWAVQDAGSAGVGYPVGTDFGDAGHELNPRTWGVTLDNWDRSMLTAEAGYPYPVAATTIVPRHPMLLTGNEANLNTDLEYDMPNSGSPALLMASIHRFGFLRTRRPNQTGALARHSDLRYLRERVAGTTATLTWEDRWTGDAYHQFPVLADRQGENHGYRYKLDWTNSGTSTTPPAVTEIQLSGLQIGDSVLLGLLRYVTKPQQATLTVRQATGYDSNTGAPEFAAAGTLPQTAGTNPALLATGSATSWLTDPNSGMLWIRITVPANPLIPGGLVNKQGDGRGVALQVTR